jgi:hypothetical protein
MSDLAIASQNQALEPPHTPTSAEALDALDEAPEVPTTPAYDYGGTTQEVPAGYVSDAELLAWLQGKSSGQYGELDRMMDMSNDRSKFVKDLSHLKETLANAAADPSAALAEIDALRLAYAGTAHAEEIDEMVGPLRTTIQNHANALAGVELQDWDQDAKDRLTAEIKAGLSAQLRGSSGSIDATIKDLEHDDQLALVQIQALMSEIRETAQLTSNIIANRSQTTDSIVGNLRA